MLDENLPTFRFRAAPDSTTDTLLHYTDRGTDPSPAFLVRRPDPSLASSRNRYAAALADPSFPSIIYAEVLVEPEWQAPSTGASSTTTAATTTTPDPRGGEPLTPSAVSIHLYDPDQEVVLRHTPSGWNRSESWEFEIPERTFRVPSASRLDRDASPGGPIPKVVLRWKKDSRLSRDMTCYMCGRSVDGRKSKEPDITVALFKSGGSSSSTSGTGEGAMLTIYEPNMRRVEVEDRKGLELILLLGAEAIRSLYLNPKSDPFNLSAAAPSAAGPQGFAATAEKTKKQRRQSGAPLAPAAVAAAAPIMSGAQSQPAAPVTSRPNQPPSAEDDRERRDREEQDRIRKMLAEEEDRERQRREAEIERETERLRQMYGVPGGAGPQSPPTQSSPLGESGGPVGEARPPLPPRPAPQSPTMLSAGNAALPQRPVSAGPYGPSQVPQGGGPSGGAGGPTAPPAPKSRIEGFVSALGPRAEGAAARASGLFQGVRDREEERRKKVQKKRSVHF